MGKVFESVLKVSVEFILHISDSLESSVRARKIGFLLKATVIYPRTGGHS